MHYTLINTIRNGESVKYMMKECQAICRLSVDMKAAMNSVMFNGMKCTIICVLVVTDYDGGKDLDLHFCT